MNKLLTIALLSILASCAPSRLNRPGTIKGARYWMLYEVKADQELLCSGFFSPKPKYHFRRDTCYVVSSIDTAIYILKKY